MILRTLALCSLLSVSTTSLAKPAPWYWWASKTTDARVCTQTSPGKGWLREAQAFRDAQCSIRH